MIEYYDTAFKPSRFLLWITGMRPFHDHVRPILGCVIAIQAVANFLTMINFLYEKSFNDIVDVIVTEFLNCQCMLRIATVMYYEKDFQHIFEDLQKLWPITDPKQHVMLRYYKHFQNFLIAVYVGLLVALSTHGFITGEPPLHFYRPGMFSETFFVIFIVDSYYCFVACVAIGFDLVFLTLTVILLIQYRILSENLQMCMNNKQEESYSIPCCIRQSDLLKGIIAKINTILGPLLLIDIWLIIIAIGMLMYMLYERYIRTEAQVILKENGDPMDLVKYFIMINGYAIDIFVYYIVTSQLLTNEINKMFEDIYCTNWYECPLPVKKSLLMILTRKETNAVITAYGDLVVMNFETCTAMFRTCFSVFTFMVHMKSFRSKDE